MAGLNSPFGERRHLEGKKCIRRITRNPVHKGNVVAASVFGMILVDCSPTSGQIKKVMTLPTPIHAL